MRRLILRLVPFAAILIVVPLGNAAETKKATHYMHAWTAHVDVDGTEYKLASELMTVVAALPEGSKLQLNTGCLGLPKIDVSPPLRMQDFKKFCAEHGVKLVVSAGLRF